LEYLLDKERKARGVDPIRKEWWVFSWNLGFKGEYLSEKKRKQGRLTFYRSVCWV
jgi:hypothetical protein